MKIIVLPTVEERKTGRWLERSDGWDDDVIYECSNCGELWNLIAGTPEENNMHYCPNCGAKMEAEEWVI